METTWSRPGCSEKLSQWDHHTCNFLPGKEDHSLSPDSSRRQSGLMILFTAWESSLKRNLAAVGKADRKKWLEGISCVSSCLHQPLLSTLQCQHSQTKAHPRSRGLCRSILLVELDVKKHPPDFSSVGHPNGCLPRWERKAPMPFP